MFFLRSIFLLISTLLFFTSCIKIDQTIRVFFPKDLSHLQEAQSEFPAFWWNFVVIDKAQISKESLDQLCTDLKFQLNKNLNVVACGDSFPVPVNILLDWSKDYFIRNEFQSENKDAYLRSFNLSLAMASFGAGPELIQILRHDPLQSWKDYQSKVSGSNTQFFQFDGNYFSSRDHSKYIIPLQFKSKPSLVSTEPIIQTLEKSKSNGLLIGPHGSGYRNEIQVKKDLSVVSVISLIVFSIFMLWLVTKTRWTILWLGIPVSIAVLLAAKATEIIYGDIHGLTLSFGSGIIGLALDYGLHGLLGQKSHQTWKSNFVGLMTTLCGIVILIYSGIPLIQQMMVFSLFGLIFGFSFYYLLFKYFNQVFITQDIKFLLPQFKFNYILIILIFVSGFIGLKNIKLNLDLKKMNFITDRELEYSKVVFSSGGTEADTYLLLSDFNMEQFYSQNYALLAKKNDLSYQGIDLYLPNINEQSIALNSWKTNGCKDLVRFSNEKMLKFFDPFYQNCSNLNESLIANQDRLKSRSYLSPFISDTHFLSIFTAHNQEQKDFLARHVPEAKSLSKSLLVFSEVFKKDLSWMIPISLLLTFIILFTYYRKISYALISLLPFATALALYFTVSLFLSIEIDLIAVLGLVMVFGFSIDYGVFAVDVHKSGESQPEIENVYSALSLASVTNILGFLPMVFAQHPVLKQLGTAMFFGSLGSYLGSIYGVYNYFTLYKKRSS